MAKYEAAVRHSPATVAYLRGRGLDQEDARTFRLGVVADAEPGHGRFTGMLAIPYLLHDGTPLALRFRCMEEHDHRAHFHGKYNSMTGVPTRVFNTGAVFKADDEIHVTEGEFDAIVLNRIGLNAVAIPGAKAWKGHHRRMLAGFSRVYVWGDPDDAGAEFAAKVTSQMRTAHAVRLEAGDVTDTYLAGGREALLALIEEPREDAA